MDRGYMRDKLTEYAQLMDQETSHYRQAVQTAATALNARTQDKLGRRDLSGTKLMQAVFNPSPKPGGAHLVVDTAGLAADTANGMQTGVMNYAVLARWIDKAAVEMSQAVTPIPKDVS
jgi:Protein of unknown function (Hypoth_ymh)